MSAEDRFEEELVTRLGAHAAGIGGGPPLAELHEAGRRRLRRQAVLRGVTAVAVLAVGAGVLTQLGGGPGSDRTGPAGAGPGLLSPSPSATMPGRAGVILACTNGPSTMRTPGWHQHGTRLPLSPPSGGLPSDGTPSDGTPSGDLPSGGLPSGGLPSDWAPSDGLSATDQPSPGLPASGLPSGGLPSGGTPTGGTHSPDAPSTDAPSSSGSLSSGPTPSGSLSPSALPTTSASDDLADTALEQAGLAIEDLGMADYRDRYFGTCRDRTTGTLHVMRVPGSGLDAAAARAAAGWPTVKVAFTDAAGSREQLMAFLNRIRADTEEWRSKGVEIEGLTLALDGSGVVVDTPQWESAAADIKTKYGPLVAEVR